METEFRVLAELCEKLETTSKRTVMVSLVAEFLKRLHADEVEPATSMILGRPFPKWDKRTLEISWATLSGLIKRLTKVDWKSFTDSSNPRSRFFRWSRRFGPGSKNRWRKLRKNIT